jgi:Flp pilus assembly protein TadD
MAYGKYINLVVVLIFIMPVLLLAGTAELSPEEGIEHYKELVRLHPNEASSQNTLGYYYFKSGKLEEAETHLLKAIQLDDSRATAHNNLGVVCLHQGRPEQAEEHFRQAVKLKPLYSKAQYNLAVALFRQRRYTEAARAYLRARELDKEYVEQRDNLEKLKQVLEQVSQDEAVKEDLERLKRWIAPTY